MEDEFGPAYFRGLYEVRFTIGEIKVIDVEMNVVNHLAHPLYLKDVGGRFYNWQNIVSIKKVK